MLASDAQHLDLDCGISHARMASWLDDELGLSRNDGGWTFSREGCTCCVQVTPIENRSFGTISLERARLTAAGDAEALAAFEKLFILRFISAGG